MNAVDLFAGPGGWDVAARELGIDPLGIELDDAACATRAAVGLRTLQADVADIDPLDYQPVDLLIASPPCPSFSAAGDGAGRRDMALISQCARNLFRGHDNRHVVRPRLEEPDSLLVVEPLRYALALRPRWIVLEQVPPVVGLWKYYARSLSEIGYSAWAGLLNAADYGVPQRRERAILIASLFTAIEPPRPTHCEGGGHTLEGELFCWVSMAKALGWGMTGRPYPTIASGRKTGGPDREKVGGSKAREAIYEEKSQGRWLNPGSGAHRRGYMASETAPTIAFANDSASWRWHEGDDPRGRRGDTLLIAAQDGSVRLSLDEAAVLQGFPPGYPWQGNSSKRFAQIGNAVPPPFARAILAAVIG